MSYFSSTWTVFVICTDHVESSQIMRMMLSAYNTYPRKLPPGFVMLWIAALQVFQRIWVWSPQYQWKSPQEYGWNLQVSYINNSRQVANRVHNSWTYCICLSETICDLRKYSENRPRTHLISVNNIHFTSCGLVKHLSVSELQHQWSRVSIH